jgi:energy-coupling factor transporter ATP-binding protein EcfA2
MPFDTRLKTSFNCLVSGPTGSGKTTFVKNLLSIGDQIFTQKPKHVFLFYKAMQDMYLEMEKDGLIDEMIDVQNGMPSLDEIHEMVAPFKNDGGSMIIFDDSMTSVNSDFELLFCNLSHHDQCSIIFMTQNLFFKDKSFRTMSLNSHYIVLMKNDRDKQQISILSKQISPNNSKYILEAYKDATVKPYDYLLLDFSPETNNIIRLRSKIFPHQFPMVTYLEKK